MVTHLNQTQMKMVSSSDKIDILFNLYLTLKVVEDESYEAFWKRHTSLRYAKIQSQRYFKEEKAMGIRYLQSKIADTLLTKWFYIIPFFYDIFFISQYFQIKFALFC